MDSSLSDILQRYWGFPAFRPMQEDIMHSVLSGKDTLALMPTGGGKSLCYQVPAMSREGLCLVISPLIALMKDQVETLRRKKITAYAIYSGMTWQEVNRTMQTVAESNCKFLYVSPERLETKLFREYLPALNITLLAVDEAHCISQWGYDFRPSYLRIAALREELPDVPLLALTASATLEVQEDICQRLAFGEHNIFRQSFARPNLSYSAFATHSRINKMVEILENVKGTALVYCKTRKRTREISELLNARNIQSDYYHAGLTQDARSTKQEAWLKNETRVMVCTNAFGMGIDKPDVRVVIHADVPDCLENYYQEAGRAGRDTQRAYAVLLYDQDELNELKEMPAVRFPSLENIRTIYQGIVNYLQLPVGGGEGQYYDFDINDFIRKFNPDPAVALNSLRALESDGWLTFNEQFFRPSMVQFNTTKAALYDFENSNPELEPLIKSLLRAYEGIFDRNVSINEKNIARLMRADVKEVEQGLRQLNSYRIIEYEPRKETPQLMLLRGRIRVEELTIDMEAYEKRKALFTQRVNDMVKFASEQKDCRSTIIGRYFGDKDIVDCGICDNCLRKKITNLNKEEFNAIHQQVRGKLLQQPLLQQELLAALPHIRKEKMSVVLDFLQAENKIRVDPGGRIHLL